MLVDFQAHWTSPVYLDSLVGNTDFPRAERRGDDFYLEFRATEARLYTPKFFDIDIQLADMDEHGIDVMITSPTHADVAGLPFEQAVSILELVNDETARIQREHPTRVVGLCMLPMEHPEAAIKELDRSIGDLGLRGVCVMANIGGYGIVNEDTKPIFAAIAAHGVPLFLHPTNSMTADKELGDGVERGLSWMADTSAAALQLVYKSVLDENPELEVVHPHAGGVLPYIRDRVEYLERHTFSDVAPAGLKGGELRDYLRHRFFADAVNDTPGALELALDIYGEGRVVYASDYPFFPRAKTLDFIRDNGLAERILDATGPARLLDGVLAARAAAGA